MGMQNYSAPSSRNMSKAGAKPGKISAPEGAVSLGKAPSPGVVGHKPGSSVKGFDGGLKGGMVKV